MPDGNETTDAQAAVTMLPAGGPKGYAIGYVMDLLSGVLSGALTSTIKTQGGITGDLAVQSGQTFIAIDIASFIEIEKYQEMVDQNAQLMRATPPRPGFSQVFIPGEIEWNTYADRIANGIPTSRAQIGVLGKMASDYGVDPFWS